jgi:hypothetical protein
VIVAGFLALGPTTVGDGLSVWVVPSLVRVLPATQPGANLDAALHAARGEYQSFQIAIQAPAASQLTNVNVSVTDLTGDENQVIPSSNITLYREQYVQVTKGSPDWGGANRPAGPGFYPDGLIPFLDPDTGQPLSGAPLVAVPFSVSPGQNQVLWVDVYVPLDAGWGQYQGAYTVICDQGRSSGQILLNVWNFTLPVKPSLKSSFLVWTTPNTPVIKELLRNKLNPLKAPPGLQLALIDAFGLTSTDLGFWSGADITHCTMAPAPSPAALMSAQAAQAPGLFLYNYTADEIGACSSLTSQLQQWARNLHAAGIKNLVTMAPAPALMDDGSGTGRSAVDVWAMLPVTYDHSVANVLAAQAKGDEAWSYNALVQDSYSPKWEIDFDPIDFRIQPGFISESLGLTGLLYWRVDLWPQNPWNAVNVTGYTQYPGEGMLVYPGATVGIRGVAPSMRLKWLRDGVQDYEYVELLKRAGAGAWALQVAAQAGSSWRNWTRDPNVLEGVRQQLGAALNGTARPQRLKPLPVPVAGPRQ